MFLNRVWLLALVECREQKKEIFLLSSLYLLVSCNSTCVCLCDYCVCIENGDFEVSMCKATVVTTSVCLSKLYS